MVSGIVELGGWMGAPVMGQPSVLLMGDLVMELGSDMVEW